MRPHRNVGSIGPPVCVVLVGCMASTNARIEAEIVARKAGVSLVVVPQDIEPARIDPPEPASLLKFMASATDIPAYKEEFTPNRRERTHPNEPFYRKRSRRGRYW